MKKLKKVIIVFVLIVCCFLTGCAKATYTFLYEDDDTLLQQLTVDLDSETITASGMDLQILKTDIADYVNNYYTNRFVFYEDAIMQLLIENNVGIQAKDLFLDAVKISRGWNGNTYTYSTQYNGVYDETLSISIPANNVYNLYNFGELVLEDDEESNMVIEEGLFIIKASETSTTVFSSETCRSIESRFETEYSEYSFDASDIVYCFEYGNQYRRLHSDTEDVRYEDGVYIHSWVLDSSDDTITLFRYYANQKSWYVLGLGVAVIMLGMFGGVLVIKNKLKSNKS